MARRLALVLVVLGPHQCISFKESLRRYAPQRAPEDLRGPVDRGGPRVYARRWDLGVDVHGRRGHHVHHRGDRQRAADQHCDRAASGSLGRASSVRISRRVVVIAERDFAKPTSMLSTRSERAHSAGENLQGSDMAHDLVGILLDPGAGGSFLGEGRNPAARAGKTIACPARAIFWG
jgi:hypothetical protein